MSNEDFIAWEREVTDGRTPPGPLSPDAEKRILDLYQRLLAEEDSDDTGK